MINWLQWLTKVSPTFEKHPEIHSSFGETLLLIAIHFHGHSLEPIIELVCSTLGIKLRPSSLTKLKILFTQQVFPEKVRYLIKQKIVDTNTRQTKFSLPVQIFFSFFRFLSDSCLAFYLVVLSFRHQSKFSSMYFRVCIKRVSW